MKYLVAYAKIITEKTKISLGGIYFGGLGNTHDEAKKLAFECVNLMRGSTTIIPRIQEITNDGNIIEAFYDVADKFDRILIQMNEANDIINRGSKKK